MIYRFDKELPSRFIRPIVQNGLEKDDIGSLPVNQRKIIKSQVARRKV